MVGGATTGPDETQGGRPPPTRKRLLELVADDPGQPMLEAARKLDVHVSTVSYHAQLLEEKGKLQLLDEGRCVRMFPAEDLSEKEVAVIAALQSPRAKDVLEFLAEEPGATKTQAADDLDLSVKGLGWHVDRLEELGVVRVDGDRRGYSLKLEEGVEPLIERDEQS